MTETLILIIKWQLALLPMVFVMGLSISAIITPPPDRRKGKA